MIVFDEYNLKNGLTCKLYKNSNLHTVTIGLYVKAGMIYEDKSNFGISHLIEHMFFRKLHDLSQKELYFKMESMGTSLRAGTYIDYIRFRIKVIPQYFYEALELIYKIFQQGDWSKELIDKEKIVVLNQIEYQTYEDFYKYVDRVYFYERKLYNKIMGKKSTVKKLSCKRINEFKNKIFDPTNMCLVITGNFPDDADVKEKISLNLSEYNGNGKNVSADLAEPAQEEIIPRYFCERTNEDVIIENIKGETMETAVIFDVPAELNLYHVKLINCILGSGVGSKLSYLLREELGITNEIYSELYDYKYFRRLVIKCMFDIKDTMSILDGIFEMINEMKHNITEGEYKSSIVFFTENQNMLYDDTEELNYVLGIDGYVRGEKISDVPSVIEKYEGIGLVELTDTAKEIFKGCNLFVGINNNEDMVKNSVLEGKISEIRGSLQESCSERASMY